MGDSEENLVHVLQQSLVLAHGASSNFGKLKAEAYHTQQQLAQCTADLQSKSQAVFELEKQLRDQTADYKLLFAQLAEINRIIETLS